MSEPLFYSLPHGHYDILRVALQAALLPTDDLLEPGRMFFGLSDDRGPIGYAVLEGDGPDRLLRSLVILHTRRRQGHGATLLARLEHLATDGEIERLHLLTRSARSFFRDRGYEDADRGAAPASIAGSMQFTSLCPASAAYLVKTL